MQNENLYSMLSWEKEREDWIVRRAEEKNEEENCSEEEHEDEHKCRCKRNHEEFDRLVEKAIRDIEEGILSIRKGLAEVILQEVKEGKKEIAFDKSRWFVKSAAFCNGQSWNSSLSLE